MQIKLRKRHSICGLASAHIVILVLVNLPVHRRPGGMGGVHFPLLCLAQTAQLVRGQFRLAKPQMLCLFRSFICIGFQLFLLGTDCSTLFSRGNGSFGEVSS